MVERGAADGGAPRFPHGHFMLPTAAGNDRNSRSEELRNNAVHNQGLALHEIIFCPVQSLLVKECLA